MTGMASAVQEDLRRISEHSDAFLGRLEGDGDYNPEHLREIERLAKRSREAWEECRRRGDFSTWPRESGLNNGVVERATSLGIWAWLAILADDEDALSVEGATALRLLRADLERVAV